MSAEPENEKGNSQNEGQNLEYKETNKEDKSILNYNDENNDVNNEENNYDSYSNNLDEETESTSYDEESNQDDENNSSSGDIINNDDKDYDGFDDDDNDNQYYDNYDNDYDYDYSNDDYDNEYDDYNNGYEYDNDQEITSSTSFLDDDYSQPSSNKYKRPRYYRSSHHHHHRGHHRSKKRKFCTSDQKLNPHTEEGRKVIARQTLHIIKTGKYTFRRKNNSIEQINIAKQISSCVKHTKTYSPNYYYDKKPRNPTIRKKRRMCQIEVVDETTFGSAKRLVKKERIKKTCVLNFASATKPGGGFRNGRTAQEESLARQSALFQSLRMHPRMYKYNRNNRNEDGFYNDYMIYSSRVPVFRSDRRERLFSRREIFRASVITSAAPNLKEITNYNKMRKQYKTIFYERCRKILLLAIERRNDAIVLGAYGCGVFENDPRFVSSIFKRLLFKGKGSDEPLCYYFDKVVFSITSKQSENYQVFSKKFKEYTSQKRK